MPSPRGAAAHQSKHFIKEDERVTVADVDYRTYDKPDEVRPCQGHEKMLSLCPTMSPGESAVAYRHPESWTWQWRYLHSGGSNNPWECLRSCRATIRRPTSDFNFAAENSKQECINSCQQYFVSKRHESDLDTTEDEERVIVEDVESNPHDEVRQCGGHEKRMSLCPMMSPRESAMAYGHPESWKWQWRHAHYGRFGGRPNPWQCLHSCRALDTIIGRPTSEYMYTIAAQKQDCVNSCQQYFVEREFKVKGESEL